MALEMSEDMSNRNNCIEVSTCKEESCRQEFNNNSRNSQSYKKEFCSVYCRQKYNRDHK